MSAGLVTAFSVRENLTLAILKSLSRLGIFVNRQQERIVAERMIESYGIRAPSAEVTVEALSGGNQQKVVLARALSTTPEVIVLDEPTAGVDVMTKRDIHGLIRRAVVRGASVLLLTSELAELIELSDEILVLRDGRDVGRITRIDGEFSEEAVIAAAFGSMEHQR